jgi:hypothetical protein
MFLAPDSPSALNQKVSLFASESNITPSLSFSSHLPTNTEKTQRHNDPYSPIVRKSLEKANTCEEINDGNQYQQFILDESEPLQIESGQSFPISANSTEAEQFEKAIPKIVEYLDKERVPWQSVGCVGRVSEGSKTKIRSTVLISASTLERSSEDTKIPDLRVGVQKAGNLELPVEFVVGNNQLQSSFSFKEPNEPHNL